MIKFSNTSVMNMDNAIRGARNPMNSWGKADSFSCKRCIKRSIKEDECPIELSGKNIDNHYYDGCYIIGPNDMDLLKKLRKAGPDHRKFMRQIFVSVDITAPLYFFKEFDTYKVATVANSTSTMHKIHSKPFTMDDFSTDHMTEQTKEFMEIVVERLEAIRQKYMLRGKNKEDWYDMIQLLPSSYNQLRTVTMNYETLVNMYHARKNHKLQEWHELCSWIESLPYAKELIIAEGN